MRFADGGAEVIVRVRGAIGGKTVGDVIVAAGGKAHFTAADLGEPSRTRRPRQPGQPSRYKPL